MNARRIRTSMVAAVLALAIGGCGSEEAGTEPTVPEWVERPPISTAPTTSLIAPLPGEPRVEEVRFTSDDFEIAGDLALPGGEGPHPALVVVTGSGSQSRTSAPGYRTLVSTFGDAGYAVLSWDKPGSGESTGEFDDEHTLGQRADILVAAIDTLAEHDAIDADRIGLWGISQAGWVMPLALEQTDRVAFVISVSGGGEDSIEQGAYQLGMDVFCGGGTMEDAEIVGTWGPQAAKGTTYELYVAAMERLGAVEGLDRFMSLEITDEGDWQPWPPEIDAYFDPMGVIEQTTIPVLAVFGEFDRYVDPIQGADAYERALATAGNELSRVELLPGVGHVMQNLGDPCAGAGTTSTRYLELLEEWIVDMATL